MNKRIRIHPSFLIYMLTITLFSSWKQALAAILTLVVHETAHCAAIVACGRSIGYIELTPFGGIMTSVPGETSMKGIRGAAIAAAGPLANYLVLICVSNMSMHGNVLSELKAALITSNLAMLILNATPVLPLDGGQVAFCIGFYLFPVSILIRILTAGGICLGCGLMLAALYLLFETSKLNLSLLILSGYLFFSAFQTRDAMIAENAYAVIAEGKKKRKFIDKLILYRVEAHTPLLSLLPYMEKADSCMFLLAEGSNYRPLSEECVRTLLLQSLELTMIQAVQKTNVDF